LLLLGFPLLVEDPGVKVHFVLWFGIWYFFFKTSKEQSVCLLSFEASVDALPNISFENVGSEYLPFPSRTLLKFLEALHPQPPPLAFLPTLGDNITGFGCLVILGDYCCYSKRVIRDLYISISFWDIWCYFSHLLAFSSAIAASLI